MSYLLEVRDIAGRYADALAESGIHGTALHAAIAASKPGNEVIAEYLIHRTAEESGVMENSPNKTPGQYLTHSMEISDNWLQFRAWKGRFRCCSITVQILTFATLPGGQRSIFRHGLDFHKLSHSCWTKKQMFMQKTNGAPRLWTRSMSRSTGGSSQSY